MKQEVLQALKDIKGSKNLKHGICSEVYLPTGYADLYEIGNFLMPYFKTWEEFSGNAKYPIPDPSKHYTPSEAFGKLPKWTGEYGKLRRELLDHLITEIEKELEGEA